MSFETALQSAVYQRLSDALSVPVYDDVPANAEFPYVVLGEDTHIPWDTDDSTGAESTITLHIWSRERGKREAKQIQGEIYAALNRYDLPVSGFHTVTMEFDYSDVILDADGRTRHGVARYRTIVEAVDES